MSQESKARDKIFVPAPLGVPVFVYARRQNEMRRSLNSVPWYIRPRRIRCQHCSSVQVNTLSSPFFEIVIVFS